MKVLPGKSGSDSVHLTGSLSREPSILSCTEGWVGKSRGLTERYPEVLSGSTFYFAG
jgi:hypothetical protein